jgi:hypothetical protein
MQLMQQSATSVGRQSSFNRRDAPPPFTGQAFASKILTRTLRCISDSSPRPCAELSVPIHQNQSLIINN